MNFFKEAKKLENRFAPAELAECIALDGSSATKAKKVSMTLKKKSGKSVAHSAHHATPVSLSRAILILGTLGISIYAVVVILKFY